MSDSGSSTSRRRFGRRDVLIACVLLLGLVGVAIAYGQHGRGDTPPPAVPVSEGDPITVVARAFLAAIRDGTDASPYAEPAAITDYPQEVLQGSSPKLDSCMVDRRNSYATCTFSAGGQLHQLDMQQPASSDPWRVMSVFAVPETPAAAPPTTSARLSAPTYSSTDPIGETARRFLADMNAGATSSSYGVDGMAQAYKALGLVDASRFRSCEENTPNQSATCSFTVDDGDFELSLERVGRTAWLVNDIAIGK